MSATNAKPAGRVAHDRSPRTSRKSAGERRAEIADAAEMLAREAGLSAITMRAVAAQLGVAPTLVVHHVPSMDVLVADTFERIVAAELAEVSSSVQEVAEGGERLETLLRIVLDGTRTEVTQVWVESWVLGRKNPNLAERVRTQSTAWRACLAACIEDGVRAGVYRAGDTEAVAGQLLGMIDGIGAHSLVGWHDDDHRVELMLRAARAMLRG